MKEKQMTVHAKDASTIPQTITGIVRKTECNVDKQIKRQIKLWTKHTVENLEEIIEEGICSEEEAKAIKTTISVLERRVSEG